MSRLSGTLVLVVALAGVLAVADETIGVPTTSSIVVPIPVFVNTKMSPTGLSLTNINGSSLVQQLSSRFPELPYLENRTFRVIDTKGEVMAALLQLFNILESPPPAIIVADNEAVTSGIKDILELKPATASIPIISAFAATNAVCDPVMNPAMVCVMPRDSLQIRATMDLVVPYFKWDSVGVVMSKTDYGRDVNSFIDNVISSNAISTTIVKKVFMGTTTTEDDDVIRSLLQNNPVGVLAFVSDSEYTRLVAAQARVTGGSKLFFMLGKYNVLRTQSLQGGAGSEGLLDAAVMTPFYTKGLSINNAASDDMSSLVLSYLMDSMALVASVPTLSAAALRMVSLEQGAYSSPSGKLYFDPETGMRVCVSYSILSDSFPLTSPLASWMIGADYPAPANTTVGPTANKVIPASPLRALTVCLASPPTCADVANLGRLILFLDNANKNKAKNHAALIPVPMNTGIHGVDGLSRLIPMAKFCNVMTGPGRYLINTVLAPVLNRFKVVQVGYTSGNPGLTSMIDFPYFSRVIPSDVFNLRVAASVCDYFDWERVIVITTHDSYGINIAAAAQKAMDDRTILVEKLYMIDGISRDTLLDVFTKIRDVDISRIVLPLLPVTDEEAVMFFNLLASMGMKDQIFIFNSIFCQYLAANPDVRLQFPSSICAQPEYSEKVLNQQLPNYGQPEQMEIVRKALFDGGFDNIANCNLTAFDPFSAFAVDAGMLLLQVTNNISAAGQSIQPNSTNLLRYIRNNSFYGTTGNYSIDGNGDRTTVIYNVNIQIPGPNATVLTFARWTPDNVPPFRYLLNNIESILWLDNSTRPPSATIRTIGFIATTTISANPGTIALSVLGFIGTFVVFAFCYRHYRNQRMLEMELDKLEEEAIRREEAEARGEVYRPREEAPISGSAA